MTSTIDTMRSTVSTTLRLAMGAGLGMGAGACFSDEPAACSPGSEGCECLDLACEDGLSCRDGTCRIDDGGTTTGPSDTTGTGAPTTAGDSTGQDSTGTTVGASGTTGGGTTGSVGTTGSASAGSTGDATAGTTGGSVCGDGIIDADEMCDGGPGCTMCVLDNWACNPLNNVPCQDGTKCAAVGDGYNVQCLPFNPDPPLMWGEVNCFYDFGPHDEACGLGLACTPSQITDTCENGTGNCCTEFCDIRDPNFECITETDECVPFWAGTPPAGLDWLGFCSMP